MSASQGSFFSRIVRAMPAISFRALERAMRLEIAERPTRRHLGKTRDARVLAHDDGRILRRDDEHVERKRRLLGRELPELAREVELAVRLVNEHRPAVRADEPLNRRACAVRREAISALPDDHSIGRALAIELRSAFAESEERAVADEEGHARRSGVEDEALDDDAGARFDGERRRGVGELDDEISRADARQR